MSKSNYLENALLAHLLQNANIANLGDATGVRGSSAAGTVEVALHTADPGEAGTQATNEATYTGYARQTIARNNTEWSVSGNQAENANPLSFPECTAGSDTLTHFSVGDGSGNILHSGALNASLAVSAGITPSFAAGALVITED